VVAAVADDGPEVELNLAAAFEAMRYEPHAAQRKVHRSYARHRVLDAGRRLGKSVIGGHELTAAMYRAYAERRALTELGLRREYWIVGPEYTDSEKEFRVLWNDLSRLGVPLDKPGSYNNPEGGQMVVSCFDKRFIVHARSAKYPSTLVGEGLSGVVLAEAAKLKETVWTKYIRPALADFKGWSIHSSTPEGKNWFYEGWLRGKDPQQPEWDSWRMPSWFNPYVFPKGGTTRGYKAFMKLLEGGRIPQVEREALWQLVADELDEEVISMGREMSAQKFEQEIAAGFTDFVGRVFKGWDEEIHVTDLQYDPRYPVYLAIDFGWTNPFVCLAVQVDVFDRCNVLAEYRCTHKDIGEIAAELERVPLFRMAKAMYPDPAEPQDAAVISKVLKVPTKGNTGGLLKQRLELIRRALKVVPEHAPDDDPDKRPQLLVDRRCYGLIYEMGEYRYPENKSEIRPDPEEPLDKDDHGPEALGRFFRGYFGPPGAPPGGKLRARVRTASVSR